jgi:septum formation inhibitor MinC
MQSNRARDYALNVPDLDSKKRSWRNLFRGIKRSAEEKRSIASENVASASKSYREIGRGANQRSQERWFAVRMQAKKLDQELSRRERESQQRAYDNRKEEKERLDKMSLKSPQDYQLAEDDEDVLQGVSEESYDIPNGLVIERTVRDGNKVTRYRKVVTKTGTYYFKADHSITSITWKRETTMVLD